MSETQEPENVARQHVISELRRLHHENKPLNLTAAKRRWPELVKEVYAIKPFWGWKSALEDAGISYQHINTELLDYCTCELCGFDGGILTAHLVLAHDTTPAEYWRDHPQAEVMCETVRAGRFRARGVIPQWEPLWSYEYALDRIKELHRHGFPLNFEWANREEKSLAQYLWHTDHEWDESLAAIGLNPENFRKLGKARHLSRHRVVMMLRQRHQNGQPLAESRLLKEDMCLLNAARRRFGSYEKALLAAKLSPDAVRLRKRVFTDEIKARLFEEMRQVVGMHGGDDRLHAVRRLRQEYHNYVFDRLGNWSKAARAAGVRPEQIMVHAPYDQQQVMVELRAWQERHGSAKFNRVRAANSSLYNAACKHFGSFWEALRAAGLVDSEKPKYPARLYPRERIMELLGEWCWAGNPRTFNAVNRARPGLADAIRREFGSLPAALAAAGIDVVGAKAGV